MREGHGKGAGCGERLHLLLLLHHLRVKVGAPAALLVLSAAAVALAHLLEHHAHRVEAAQLVVDKDRVALGDALDHIHMYANMPKQAETI